MSLEDRAPYTSVLVERRGVPNEEDVKEAISCNKVIITLVKDFG